jgi:hypothetical protein
MKQMIAEVIGVKFNPVKFRINDYLSRIEKHIPREYSAHELHEHIKSAREKVHQEGLNALADMVAVVNAEPKERVLKIKSSPKGDRIDIPAANGIYYSYSPKWNDSVKSGKGIAVAVQNREKLNHQGLMFGIENPEQLSCKELAEKIKGHLGDE